MKKQIILLVSITILSTGFYACKKEDQQALDAKTKQFNDDSNNFKAESDQADNDVNNTINEIPAFGAFLGVGRPLRSEIVR